MRRITLVVAASAAALLLSGAGSEAFAQRGAGSGGRVAAPMGRAEISRPIERSGSAERRALTDRDMRRRIDTQSPLSLRSRVTSACLADSAAEFCRGRGTNSTLRRRLWNACHGDNPPTVCRRVFGRDDENSHLRRRIWNACHGEDANPAFCRRIYNQDPTSPHLRRRVQAACDDGSLSPSFCRRVLADA